MICVKYLHIYTQPFGHFSRNYHYHHRYKITVERGQRDLREIPENMNGVNLGASSATAAKDSFYWSFSHHVAVEVRREVYIRHVEDSTLPAYRVLNASCFSVGFGEVLTNVVDVYAFFRLVFRHEQRDSRRYECHQDEREIDRWLFHCV